MSNQSCNLVMRDRTVISFSEAVRPVFDGFKYQGTFLSLETETLYRILCNISPSLEMALNVTTITFHFEIHVIISLCNLD